MSSVHAIGVDPGKMTGLSLWTDDHWVGSWQSPMNEAEDWLWDWLQTRTVHYVFLETYEISQRTLGKVADSHWSLDQRGSMRWIARHLGHIFELQKVADAKKFGPDERLRELGWYVSTPGGHANDAARHLLLGLSRHKEYRPLESLPHTTS